MLVVIGSSLRPGLDLVGPGVAHRHLFIGQRGPNEPTGIQPRSRVGAATQCPEATEHPAQRVLAVSTFMDDVALLVHHDGHIDRLHRGKVGDVARIDGLPVDSPGDADIGELTGDVHLVGSRSGPSEIAWVKVAVPTTSTEASPGTSSPASIAVSPEAVISMCWSSATSYWNSSPEVRV